jgi:hypothetical protein
MIIPTLTSHMNAATAVSSVQGASVGESPNACARESPVLKGRTVEMASTSCVATAATPAAEQARLRNDVNLQSPNLVVLPTQNGYVSESLSFIPGPGPLPDGSDLAGRPTTSASAYTGFAVPSISVTRGSELYVSSFIDTVAIYCAPFEKWFEALGPDEQAIHAAYIFPHLTGGLRGYSDPVAFQYERAFLSLYHAAMQETMISNFVLCKEEGERRDAFMTLFSYIENLITSQARYILRDAQWRVPFHFRKNVRRHIRGTVSPNTSTEASPIAYMNNVPVLFTARSPNGVQMQSGLAERKESREKRENAYRQKAARKLRAEYLALPKHVRALRREQARSSRLSSLYAYDADAAVRYADAENEYRDKERFSKQAEDAFLSAVCRAASSACNDESVEVQGYSALETASTVVPLVCMSAATVAFVALCHRLSTSDIAASISSLCGNLGRAAGTVASSVERTAPFVAGAGEALADSGGLFVQFMQGFNAMVEGVRATFSSLVCGDMWYIGVVMVSLYALTCMGKTIGLVATWIFEALKRVLGSTWSAVSDIFQQAACTQTVEMQSGLSGLFPQAFAAIFLATAFTDGKRWQDTLMRRLSLFSRSGEGVQAFADWVRQVAQESINWALSFFSDYRVDWVSKAERPFRDAERMVEELDALFLIEGGGVERADKCVDALRIIAGLKEIYRGLPMEKAVHQLHVRVAAHLNTVAGSLQARNNFRPEPVMIVLRGKPGVGKTAIATPFVTACLLSSGILGEDPTPADALRHVWSKSTSEYWNGYVGQEAIVVDDIFQTVQDHTNVENDYINMVRMIGSFAMPLNMADLTSKGREYFRSSLVFATTNVENVGGFAKCIVDETAILRRMKYVYDVEVKPEYALPDGKLDPLKYAEELLACKQRTGLHDNFPWHVWQAHEWDLATNAGASRKSSKCIELTTLFEMVGKNIRANRVLHEAARESVEHMVKTYNIKPEVVTQAGGVENGLECGTPAGEEMSTADDPDVPDGTALVKHEVPAASPTVEQFVIDDSKAMVKRKWMPIINLALLSLTYAALLGTACYIAWKVTKVTIEAIFDLLGIDYGKKKKKPPDIGKWTTQSNRPIMPHLPQKLSATNIQVQSLDNAVANKIYKDCYKICVWQGESLKAQVGTVIAVGGHVMLQPAHFTAAIANSASPTDTVVFQSATNITHKISFSVKQYLGFKRFRAGKEDVEFFLVPDTVRSFKQKIKHFIKSADVPFVTGQHTRLDVTTCEDDTDGSKGEPYCQYLERWIYMQKVSVGHNVDYQGFEHPMGWTYRAATEVGDCGSPLMLTNDPLNGRVLMGIHVAMLKGPGLAFAPVVTQELVLEAIAALEKGTVYADIEDVYEDDLEVQAGRFDFTFVETDNVHLTPGPMPELREYRGSGSFMPLYVLNKGPRFSPATRYYPTKLYGEWGECPVQPAKLRPFQYDDETIYPMLKAYEPYMTELRHLDYDWLDQAVHDAMRPFSESTLHNPRTILTFEQAVAGVPALGFKGVPRNTSPGFPWTLKYKHGKKDMFGHADEYVFDTEGALEVRARVEEVIGAAREGKRLMHFCSDFPKDELRTHEKVKAGKTRMISGTSVDYSIACRMYFGAFVAALNGSHAESGLCPGMCVYTDWMHLRGFLTRHGPRVFDGDFKGFDASQQPGPLTRFLRFINRWYNDGNDRIREVLFLDLINSRHMCGRGNDQRWLVQWTKGMPSGHFLTSTVNSMYSMTVLAAAFGNLTGVWGQFWDHVSAATLGDDNAVNPSEVVIDTFNQVTVAAFVAKTFHMEYTAGRKGEELVPYLGIEDITFLCRSFAMEEGNVVCPLKLESFLYTAYYCRNRLLEDDTLASNLEFALEELSMHTEEVWERYAGVLIATLRDVYGRETRAVPTKSGYLRLVLSRTDNGW